MQQSYPFAPFPGSQKAVGVTNASAVLTIAAVPQGGCSARISNAGTDSIAWRWQGGDAGSTAAQVSVDVFMLAGEVAVFECPAGVTGIAVIGLTGGSISTLRVVLGYGS